MEEKDYDCECLRCGHKWKRLVKYPKVCPVCRSPWWDRPRLIDVDQRGEIKPVT